jgi:hypothetical protein
MPELRPKTLLGNPGTKRLRNRESLIFPLPLPSLSLRRGA